MDLYRRITGSEFIFRNPRDGDGDSDEWTRDRSAKPHRSVTLPFQHNWGTLSLGGFVLQNSLWRTKVICRFRTSKWWQNDGFWVDDPCKGQYFPLLLIFRVRNMKLLTSTESGCVHFNPDSSEIHFSKSFLSTLKTLTAWNLIIARDQT